jgi:glucosamine-6-phosphate deaminase
MKTIQTKNYSEMSKKAADIIISQVNKKPNSTICLPTGKTPMGTYKSLIKENKRNKVDFSKTQFFNLDEYYPIDPKNKLSFTNYLYKKFFNHVNATKSKINLLKGNTKNPKKECEKYEDKIKKNPIDLLVLGIGINGHIAFNEPGSNQNSKTRLIKLSKETIKNKFGFFTKQKPKSALTIGIKTILSSKKIILLASGKKKTKAINKLIKEKPNKKNPASFLKNHKNLTIIFNK